MNMGPSPATEPFVVEWKWIDHLNDRRSERFLFAHVFNSVSIMETNTQEIATLRQDGIAPRLISSNDNNGYIVVQVDPDNLISESNEENNVLIFSLGQVCREISAECLR